MKESFTKCVIDGVDGVRVSGDCAAAFAAARSICSPPAGNEGEELSSGPTPSTAAAVKLNIKFITSQILIPHLGGEQAQSDEDLQIFIFQK